MISKLYEDNKDLYMDIVYFIQESNEIEQIVDHVRGDQIDEFQRFMYLPKLTIDDMLGFIAAFQPDAQLRSEYGMDVRVGKYIPPMGGPEIATELQDFLDKINENIYDPYDIHIAFEKLHPFTDCNGRLGRAIWAWAHKKISRGFLIPFYFETLRRVSK